MTNITDNFVIMFGMACVLLALILQTAHGFFDADVGEVLIGLMIIFQAVTFYFIFGEDDGPTN